MACFNKSNSSFSPTKIVKIVGSEFSSDHTEYIIKIVVGIYEWKVSRRYSEFLKLNETLPIELKDVAKQLLPKKHFFGSNSESVVKDRQNKLETYLQCLFRSLHTLPHSVLQFLKFDVYEIHGITESLAEELYNKGDEILDKMKTFCLGILQVHAISRRMELPEPTSTGDPKRDVGHLLDFINRLKSLKVIGNSEKFGTSDIYPNDLSVHFQHFKSLDVLIFDNCNFQRISLNNHLKKNVKKLKVSNSVAFISEVLLAGVEWENQCSFPINVLNELSFTSLESADFTSNRIHTMDASLKLLPKLKSLNLSQNGLERLEMLSELSSLQHLNVSHNKLDNNSSLVNVQSTSVTTLDISHNRLKSLAALVELKSLSVLDASFNEIEAVEELCCLGKLPSLEEVKLIGNPVYMKPGYRLLVLEMFGDDFLKVTLDSEKTSEKEKDAILVRLAIQAANQNSPQPTQEAKPPFFKSSKDSSEKPAPESSQHSTNCSSSSNPENQNPASSPDLGCHEVVTTTTKSMIAKCSDDNSDARPAEISCCEPDDLILPTIQFPPDPPTTTPPIEADPSPRSIGEVMVADGVEGQIRDASKLETNETQGSSTKQRLVNNIDPAFSFGIQRIENNYKSTSLKQSRRRKYFLLPETLPNHNNRCLMSLLEDSMDPPDSFGLPEVEYRHNNMGHVMWCSALTNLRKSSHAQERPVCVCVTPFKIHVFKVDHLRGDSGIPKLRYFTFVLISDIHCFMIGSRHLYVRIIDRYHPSHVVVLLTFNRIKTESFLEHVKKASRRNVPFLDDYEDPVVINSSEQSERQMSEFLTDFESNFDNGGRDASNSDRLRFYQLVQLNSPELEHSFRTSSVAFDDNFFHVVFQDFAHFPKSSNNILEFIPSKPAQHRVAAIFPLTCSLHRVKQYDGETMDGLEKPSDSQDFIGYGLELHFSVGEKPQILDLRWPTSCMRREFMVHFHEAFASKHPPAVVRPHLKLETLLNGEGKKNGSQKSSFRKARVYDDRMIHPNFLQLDQ